MMFCSMAAELSQLADTHIIWLLTSSSSFSQSFGGAWILLHHHPCQYRLLVCRHHCCATLQHHMSTVRSSTACILQAQWSACSLADHVMMSSMSPSGDCNDSVNMRTDQLGTSAAARVIPTQPRAWGMMECCRASLYILCDEEVLVLMQLRPPPTCKMAPRARVARDRLRTLCSLLHLCLAALILFLHSLSYITSSLNLKR